MSKKSSVYKKLLPSGLLDTSQIEQIDYDLLVQYIKKSFPNATSLQRDVELTLKRTFVLGTSESKNQSFRKPVKAQKGNLSRTARLKKRKVVPKHLEYEQFIHLNLMWMDYVADLLKDNGQSDTEEIQLKLNRMDYHGANIKVVQSNCKDHSGLEGIVIKETKNTFVVVTKENKTKTIPKSENVFDIEVREPQGTMRIAGNSFITRPADRASKKTKSFMEFVGSRVYKSSLRYSKL